MYYVIQAVTAVTIQRSKAKEIPKEKEESSGKEAEKQGEGTTSKGRNRLNVCPVL